MKVAAVAVGVSAVLGFAAGSGTLWVLAAVLLASLVAPAGVYREAVRATSRRLVVERNPAPVLPPAPATVPQMAPGTGRRTKDAAEKRPAPPVPAAFRMPKWSPAETALNLAAAVCAAVGLYVIVTAHPVAMGCVAGGVLLFALLNLAARRGARARMNSPLV